MSNSGPHESPETAPVTPDGVLLGVFEPGSKEWDQARAGLCITATEIPAVLGLSPWQSRFSLWHKKAGLPTAPFQMNPAMEWGTRLEPAVVGKFADDHPEWLSVGTGTWQNRDRPWQRATPDRLLIPRTPAAEQNQAVTALLEAKTSPFGDDWGDGLPIYYRAQVLWQLDTLGLTTCHVALLVSGHDYSEYTVEYDATDAQTMRDAAVAFLNDVALGVRPPIDSSDATYQTIRRQPEGVEDVDVDIDPLLAERYEDAFTAAKAADENKQLAVSEVLDAIGNGRHAVSLGRRIATRSVRSDGTTHALQPARSKGIAA